MSAISIKAKENQRQYQKNWVDKNRDKTRLADRRYYRKNRESILQQQKELRVTNPEIESEIKTRYRRSINGRFNNLKGGARKRNLSFEITMDDYVEITVSPCVYCSEITNNRGIDRVDNNIGYIKSNCASCCHRCNMMKREMSVKDFLNQIQKICNRFSVINKLYGK